MTSDEEASDTELGDPERDVFLRYALDMKNQWLIYHAHKERMYFASTTIFVGGSFAATSYLLGNSSLPISTLIASIVGYAILTIAYFDYRNVQLRYKETAAFLGDGFAMVALEIHTRGLKNRDIVPVDIDEEMPARSRQRIGGALNIHPLPRVILPALEKLDEAEGGSGSKQLRTRSWIVPCVGITAFVYAWAQKIYSLL